MSAKRLLWLFAIFLIAVGSLLLTILAPHKWGWFFSRLIKDFWPIDSSRVAPNILASTLQWAIVGIVVTFLYRPAKRWIDRELDHVNAKIDHAINENPNTPPLPEHLKGRPNERK
jgi:hypothetical protein